LSPATMSIETPAIDLSPAATRGERRYLRSLLAVTSIPGRTTYLVLHLGSGTMRTDRLGILVIRALTEGKPVDEAIAAVENMEPGAGERAGELIDQLALRGALTNRPPWMRKRQWRSRRLIGWVMGGFLGVACRAAYRMPIRTLAWTFNLFVAGPGTLHMWRSRKRDILGSLRASGYDELPASDVAALGRRSAACGPANGLLLFLSLVMPRDRFLALVDRLVDRESMAAEAERLAATGGAVGVFLHTPLIVSVPHALRVRGVAVVRTVTGNSHGLNVSAKSGPMVDFFGDPTEMVVEVHDGLDSATLVRHLKAGRVVQIALETVAPGRQGARVNLMGHVVARNDGPAWLAVRSGCPLTLWTTRRTSTGAALESSSLLYPDPAIPAGLRVAELSERLYRKAEDAIRRHPSEWGGWGFLDLIRGQS
jgi:hypothetical protein